MVIISAALDEVVNDVVASIGSVASETSSVITEEALHVDEKFVVVFGRKLSSVTVLLSPLPHHVASVEDSTVVLLIVTGRSSLARYRRILCHSLSSFKNKTLLNSRIVNENVQGDISLIQVAQLITNMIPNKCNIPTHKIHNYIYKSESDDVVSHIPKEAPIVY